MTKICTKCGEDKPLDAYGPHATGRLGLQPRCRDCLRAAQQRQTPLAERHREQRALRLEGKKRCSDCGEVKLLTAFSPNRAQRTDGRATQCKPCNTARVIARQKADPVAYGDRHKRWRDTNPERASANARKAASARRARIRGQFVEHVDPFVVYDRDDGRCGLCDEPVSRDRFDVDHVTPLACGGAHAYDNVRLAHVSCNRRRGRQVANDAALAVA